MAKKRIWLATPYFVPDATIVDALQLAALQGIDVRIIIPKNPDSYLPYLAAFSYLPEVEESGIKIYRYKEGFMHQKVILIDDELASIGTANFDNRSMRLNFEISMLVKCKKFADKVEAMLKADLEKSYLCTVNDYMQKSFWFKVAVKFFRLLSPIL
jgi:cardiolipin synthase